MSRIQYTKAPAAKPYEHHEYPKLLYKHGELRPLRVTSKEQEESALSQGWDKDYIEPAAPPAPKTELELALEQRDISHGRFVDALKADHSDTIRSLQADLAIAKQGFEALKSANAELSVERLALINKVAELERQAANFVGELNTANKRADDLVAQLGAAQQEIAELKKKAPIAPKFPTHKQKED